MGDEVVRNTFSSVDRIRVDGEHLDIALAGEQGIFILSSGYDAMQALAQAAEEVARQFEVINKLDNSARPVERFRLAPTANGGAHLILTEEGNASQSWFLDRSLLPQIYETLGAMLGVSPAIPDGQRRQ